VVLVGQGRAEQRHDPVAHDLVHGALVAVHRLHHQLEHWVQQLSSLLGAPIGQQFHRPLEVGEEDSDLLALALEGALGREDLLGEMLGGVGLRRREANRFRGKGRSAGPTELLPRTYGLAATRAREFKASPALLTEASPFGVLLFAARTLHAGASQRLDDQGGTPRLVSGNRPVKSPLSSPIHLRNARYSMDFGCRACLAQ
jgi:hypothetical protein